MRKLDAIDFERMHLPKLFWQLDSLHGDVHFPLREDAPPESVVAFAARYVERLVTTWPKFAGSAVLISGATGTGKSVFLSHLLMAMRGAISGSSALYMTAPKLFEAARNDKIPFDSETSLWERIETCSFLAIDDLSEADARDRFGVPSDPILSRLLSNRRNARLLTWIGTRIVPTGVKDIYPGLYDVLDTYLQRILLTTPENLYKRYSRDDAALIFP